MTQFTIYKEQTTEKLTSISGIILRLVKPAFIGYNENSFTFHCDRIDSDQFKQYAGSIYRVGRWNACGLLHNDWGNSLESETETKVRNGIRDQQETEVGQLDSEMTCTCSCAAKIIILIIIKIKSESSIKNSNNNNNDNNNGDNGYDKDDDVKLPISFDGANM